MESKRLLISSGTQWETVVGYSRAVRVGQIIEVAGTTAVDENGSIVGEGDVYRQTLYTLEKIRRALQQAGACLEDVVRTRMYVRNIKNWEAIGRAHGEVFQNIRPVATMVEVSALIDERLLVEIEATAIVAG
jgi:enamine deaminase RidA (YjgF/YER057c/UK114 family)